MHPLSVVQIGCDNKTIITRNAYTHNKKYGMNADIWVYFNTRLSAFIFVWRNTAECGTLI